jgi:hypothetical protein
MPRYRLEFTESPTQTVIEVEGTQDLGAVLHALEHGASAAGWGDTVSMWAVDDDGNERLLEAEEEEMIDRGQFGRWQRGRKREEMKRRDDEEAS